MNGSCEESLSGSWLSSRLGVGTQRLDAMRRAGELLGVRRPGGQDYLYPAWQFAPDGKPLPVIQRLVRAGRGAGPQRRAPLRGARLPAPGISGDERLADALRAGPGRVRALGRPRAPRMALVSLNAVRKSFGSRTVLDGLDFAIEPRRPRRRRSARTAPASRRCCACSPGSRSRTPARRVRRRGIVVSFLPQHPLGDERTALETVRAARPDLDELDRELHRVAEQLASPELAADLDRMARVLRRQEELVERWEAAGGPSIDGRARAMLLDVGLEEADLTLPTSALSGGQRKLIALAACLAQDPDVLLLDEPEAHLDAVGRSLLERLLAAFDGAAVAVSHDRYLLDETVSQIAELDRGRIRMWPGNYSAYTLARELELQRQQQHYVTQQKEIERLEAAMRRFEDWARRVVDERHIKQARNKQRQIDRMEKVERPVLERRKIALRLHPHVRGGQRVFELRHVGIAVRRATSCSRTSS